MLTYVSFSFSFSLFLFIERDYLHKIILQNKSSLETPIGESNDLSIQSIDSYLSIHHSFDDNNNTVLLISLAHALSHSTTLYIYHTGEVMEPEVICVHSNTPVKEALNLFVNEGIRNLPIVNLSGGSSALSKNSVI